MNVKRVCVALFLATALPASAAVTFGGGKLESYESNSIGWTDDSDDVAFLDLRLSLKYALASWEDRASTIYFAASTRFAQYLGTRESSPVVGKRFNPKLIWRTGKDEYIDLAFAHESNGQSIDTEEVFRVEQEVARFPRGRAEFARDYISRGWDYLELAGRRNVNRLGNMKLDFSLKHFLRQGPLQGEAEDFYPWERDDEVKPRRQVHGLAATGTWRWTDWRLRLGYETGYSRPFRHSTVRTEIGTRLAGLTLMAFHQNGHGSDLALYYKRVSTIGIAVELSEFE